MSLLRLRRGELLCLMERDKKRRADRADKQERDQQDLGKFLQAGTSFRGKISPTAQIRAVGQFLCGVMFYESEM